MTISPGPSTAGIALMFGGLCSQREAPGRAWENQRLCGSEVVCHFFVAYAHHVRRTWSEMHLWSNSLSWGNLLYSHDVSEVSGPLALRKQTIKISVIKNYGQIMG